MTTQNAQKAPDRVVIGFEDSTPLLGNPDQLRERADRDGFLFFKQLLPREPLLELRGQIRDILDRRGWLDHDYPLDQMAVNTRAVAETDRRDESMKHLGITLDAYKEIQRLELFHRIPHAPELTNVYEQLFGGPVLLHPRNIARVLLPSPSAAPTPPHQDYIFIQGSHSFWTCWFPLGDCPMDLGGLSILRGSHKEEILDVALAQGAGRRESILCGKDHYAWVQDHYRCGDFITFPSHTVHKGLPNQHSNRVRLSLDIRFQARNEPVCSGSLNPHELENGQDWEDIYADWKRDDLKYYWKDWNLEIVDTDMSLIQNVKEKIC